MSDRASPPADRYVCIHGHFYQPPRENPWLETVEAQDSAHPYHDWNERVTAECYAPNGAARILDPVGRIAAIVNNYARMSFNFGPTLLAWMETGGPDTYRAILEADRASQRTFSGHGSAIAQAYNHMVLPLANRRDKRTQVVWGVRDFKHRFGRRPEGMWLPETAVDLETLELLAELGIRFTILAPHQARQVRPLGSQRWESVEGGRIDPSMPYEVRLPSGRRLALLFYDGPASRGVAFEGLLASGERLSERLEQCFSDARGHAQLVHIATDGESYGHHHTFGDQALAYALEHLESSRAARITNYGEYVALHPPTHEVEIIEDSSWSCVHGVERWRSDCGCNSGSHEEWRQEWRAPLRDALEWLRDTVAPRFEERGGQLLRDPWAARDDYVGVVLDRSEANVDGFLARHAAHWLNQADQMAVLQLLEMQRHAMLMFTSCGWFFDELSGIETVQVMQYAGRVAQLADEVFDLDLEAELQRRLGAAKSNLPEHQDGAELYARLVKPAMVNLSAVAAHYAISKLLDFDADADRAVVHCYQVTREQHRAAQSGREKLVVGRARVASRLTRETATVNFAVLSFADRHIRGGGRLSTGEAADWSPARDMFEEIVRGEIFDAFRQADLPRVLRLIDEHFGETSYGLTSLFRDERAQVLAPMTEAVRETVESLNRQAYEHGAPLMRSLRQLGLAPPAPLLAAASLTLNADLRHALGSDRLDGQRIRALLTDIDALGVELDSASMEGALQATIARLAERLRAAPTELPALTGVKAAVDFVRWAPWRVNLWKAQNVYWDVLCRVYPEVHGRAERGDEDARAWTRPFLLLGEGLGISVRAMIEAGENGASAVEVAEAILAESALAITESDSPVPDASPPQAVPALAA